MEKNNNNNVTDLTYLRQVSNGDNDFIKEMIEVYMQQTPEAINNLEKHLKNKDWKMLRAVTHKMKPSFSFFGLKDLYDIADSMEEYSAKEIHLELLPDMIDKVKLTCNKAMVELEEKKSLAAII
jgi:HPt (histidine-containing phosphotransfer) domain-containing protein